MLRFEPDTAESRDRDALFSLFERCFPEDSPEFRSAVMERLFRPEETLVVRDGEKPASAVMLPRFTLTGGETFGYVYCLCTGPEYRGMGLMRRLMDSAHEFCARRGDAFTALVPADAGLALTYGKMGYAPAGFCLSGEKPGPEPGGRPGSFSDIPFLNALYEREFAAAEHVGRDGKLWETLMALYGADGGGIRVFDGGYLMLERMGGELRIREKAGEVPPTGGSFLLPGLDGTPRFFARGAGERKLLLNLLFD